MDHPTVEGRTSVPGRRDFPSTCWSRILGMAGADPAKDREALEELAERYWKPVYAYIRSSWSKSHDDAKDLTQDFFLWMMESAFLSKADPARGRFRALVQVSLRHYLSNHERENRRQKRGGGGKLLRLGGTVDWGIADAAGREPEAILTQAWKRELLTRAAAALEDEYRALGRETAYRVFQVFHLNVEGPPPNYREIAGRYGITEKDVSNFLMRAKERYRAILVDLVSETVADSGQLREELQCLFGRGVPA